MPFSKGSAKLQHFSLIRKFTCGFFDDNSRKNNFYTFIFVYVRKKEYLCHVFDNYSLQNGITNPINSFNKI